MANEETLTVHENKDGNDQVPAELKEKAEPAIENYLAFLREQTQLYKQQAAEAQLKPEAAEPIVAGYQYWNVFTRGPYEFSGDAPYLPSRVIPVGRWALLVGVVWINPVIPAPWVFAGKRYQVRFETINLSRVTDGPDGVFNRAFPAVSDLDSINEIRWWFRPTAAGLYETSLTVDLTMSGMPFAAYSTWHRDPEGHLGIPGQTPPPIPAPHWHHDVPARYLVYQQ
jgi:hypothetical protein